MIFLTWITLIFTVLQISISEDVLLDASLQKGSFQQINLGTLSGWKFSPSDSSVFSLTKYDDSEWRSITSKGTGRVHAPQDLWTGMGWFRLRFTTDSTFQKRLALIIPVSEGAMEIFINGEKIIAHGNPASSFSEQIIPGRSDHSTALYSFLPNSEYCIAVRYSFVDHTLYQKISFGYLLQERAFDIEIYDNAREQFLDEKNNFLGFTLGVAIAVLLLVLVLHFALFLVNPKDQSNIWVVFLTSLFLFIALFTWLPIFENVDTDLSYALIRGVSTLLFFVLATFTPYATGKLLHTEIRPWWGHLRWAAAFYFILLTFFPELSEIPIVRLLLTVTLFGVIILGCVQAIRASKKEGNADTWLIALALISFPFWYLLGSISFIYCGIDTAYGISLVQMLMLISLPILFSIYQGKKFISMHKNMEGLVEERTRQLAERNEKLETANEEIQRQRDEVVQARDALETSLEELKSTQDQLIQQEKLASLGQLTAGIAHEIKNPLNFVNNFSELSIDLIEEALEEIARIEGNDHAQETADILADVKSNLSKIHSHGTRANSIVNSMLMHSRASGGEKKPTDFNAVVKEFVGLSFHGMRAGKNPINVDIQYDLDDSVGEVSLITEDFSRVILNLSNNAFDAMRERLASRTSANDFGASANDLVSERDLVSRASANSSVYEPKLTVRTRKDGTLVVLEIEDNGLGIPEEIKDKILQPFFTTKKGTEGTGLGLSITNDIVKAHGGTLDVRSNRNGTVFSIAIATA